jgi:HSP20 family protein
MEDTMALLQWREAFEPFGTLRELQDRMNQLFDHRTGGQALFGVEHGTSTFPPLDIRHDVERVFVIAELPGVAPESLDVSITGDTLSIKGERKAPEVKDEKFHRRERAFGHFNRLVSLPDRVDAEKIEASLKDGILRVTLPKAESAKPRSIKVSQS